MIEKSKALEVVNKIGDFIDAGVEKNGGKFLIRFDDVEQMNEFCIFVGLPPCEHGRDYLAKAISNPSASDPNAREVCFGRVR
jgi:hypothetical protein